MQRYINIPFYLIKDTAQLHFLPHSICSNCNSFGLIFLNIIQLDYSLKEKYMCLLASCRDDSL